MIATLLYKIPCILGEGPMWHTERNSLFWADIEGKSIYEYNDAGKTLHEWKLDYRVSMIVQDVNGHLILALQGGLAKFDLHSGKLQWLVDIENNIPNNRCNDGGCDVKGRIWIGTMDIGFKPGAGSLYCIDKSLNLKKQLEGVTISNGLVWSADNKTAYYIDSPTQTVRSYFFDAATGSLSSAKVVIHIPENMGTPDGMSIDEEGMLWIAHWGGFGVYCWNPFIGRLLKKIELPVPNVSSCTFGGEKLDHLFITTASQQLSDAGLKKYPDSGSVFTVKMPVKGMAAYKSAI
jgi:sugar lactone lactonase YvrE